MRNARETIDYYNRKFVVNVAGAISDFTGEMEFKMPPINDTTFSTGYNQCLIRIKHIIIGNDTAALPDQVNPVFVTNNGGGVSSCITGIMVRTSIPSRQVKSVSDNFIVAHFGEGHDQSFHQILVQNVSRLIFAQRLLLMVLLREVLNRYINNPNLLLTQNT